MFITSRGDTSAEPILKNTVRGAIFGSVTTTSVSVTSDRFVLCSGQGRLQLLVGSSHFSYLLLHGRQLKSGNQLWRRTVETTFREVVSQTKRCTEHTIIPLPATVPSNLSSAPIALSSRLMSIAFEMRKRLMIPAFRASA